MYISGSAALSTDFRQFDLAVLDVAQGHDGLFPAGRGETHAVDLKRGNLPAMLRDVGGQLADLACQARGFPAQGRDPLLLDKATFQKRFLIP